jgi:mRNA-degrading endonuclease RelE of RelBE toxin-antitoxin system
MNYNVIATPHFKRELKRLSKKYSSLKKEFAALITGLETKPVQGKPLGRDCYKIRLMIASKGRGKSGGARVIINISVSETTVFLLSVYDKSEKESVSDKQLEELLKGIP